MKPDDSAPPPNPPPKTDLVPARPATLEQLQGGQWYGLPGYAEQAPPPGGGFSAYLHALRRRWLVVTGVGLVCAAVLGAAVWFSHVPLFTARFSLRVKSIPEKIVPDPTERFVEYELYKGTLVQFLKSPFLLIAALRDVDLNELPTIREEPDPVAWLRDHIQPRFPGDGEIMEISITGEHRKELAELLERVVAALLVEVVDKERAGQRQRLSLLDKIIAELETALRDMKTDLEVLVKDLGTGDSEALSVKQQITLQHFDMLRRELTRVQFELMHKEMELQLMQAALEGPGKLPLSEAQLPAVEGPAVSEAGEAEGAGVAETEVPAVADAKLPLLEDAEPTLRQRREDAELDAAAQSDPLLQSLIARREGIKKLLRDIERDATADVLAQYRERFQPELDELNEQIRNGKELLRERLKTGKPETFDDPLAALRFKVAILSRQEEQLRAKVDEIVKEAEKFGSTSLDVEMLRGEIALKESLRSQLASKRQNLAISADSWKPRVERLEEKVAVPTSPDKDKKASLTLMAILAGFFVPGCVIVWWDTHGKRVNTSAEVAQGTGLEVIGAMPLIPAKAARNLAGTSPRYHRWRATLAESVDNIAARLLRQAELDQTRVVLVTSAVGGEGKTTVATQLALSLARTGHHTVLVDFDLRRPAIDQLLGLPLEPGVSEMLREESQLQEVLQQTPDTDLAVVTAGRWNFNGMGVLSNGVAGGFIDKLREEFDFVVLDGSPILPVVDARFLSRYVDGVVLAVLRDVSRIPKILETCEILGKFGVRTLGAVVTGSPSEVHYSHGYHDSRDST